MKKKNFIAYIFIFTIIIPSVTFSYDRERVRKYLERYANNWNRRYNFYRDFPKGADCANFVSQVLIAGCYAEALKKAKGTDNRWCFTTGDRLYEFLKGISISCENNFGIPHRKI